MTDSPRLLLVDGHSLAYRAFYALKEANLVTTTGQHTEAVYGFTSMLINVLRDEQPTHVVVAFDVSRRSFRTEQYADYKAGRAESPPDFAGQVDLVKEVLAALGIPVVEAPGYEADDAIATLARQARAAGMEVLISTGDRDIFQLVGEGVTALYAIRGVSELARMDPAAVTAKYGVGPERYRDLAALVGEPSDNLSGVPGVGPKTAAKWIGQFGSLDAVVAQVDQIKGKAGDSLRAHLADVLRNYELNRLVDDLDLPLPVEQAQWGGADRDAVHQVFDTLEFRGELRERAFKVLAPEAAAPESGFDMAGELLSTGQVAGWLETHTTGGAPGGRGGAARRSEPAQSCGVAVDGTFGQGTGTLSGMALAVAGGPAAWFDPAALDSADEAAVAAWLADPARPKLIHDVKPALLAIEAHGWQLAGVAADTALAAYLARPDRRTYDLVELARDYLHRELRVEGADDPQPTLDGLGPEGEQEQALMLRARATLDLDEPLSSQLTEGSARLLGEVELPLVRVLAGMEQAGIAADTDYLSELEAHFAAEVKAAAQAAYQVVGREFNLGSPKQLQEILFVELELPKTKRIKTGYTTDADALQALYNQTGHPVLEHLLHHRDFARLKSTVDGLLKAVSPDGRIHTTFFQTVAATGRLSSTDPNLQNVPIRTEAGRRIRRAFIVGERFEALLTADYSQIEMRIMAHLCEDPTLVEAFRSGADFHAVTAASVFGVDRDQVTPDQRRKIKAMNFGLAYGLSAFGLSQQLQITPAEARELMEEYFSRFGAIRDYLQQVVAVARKEGYTETMLGRRRWLPDLTSDNRQRREMAERMALNAPIQGSAADIIKVAMLRIDTAIRAAGLASRMLLQVHDELIFEVAPGEQSALTDLVHREMSTAHPLTVPLDVSTGTGPDWHSASH